jgi:hypothetical protein
MAASAVRSRREATRLARGAPAVELVLAPRVIRRVASRAQPVRPEDHGVHRTALRCTLQAAWTSTPKPLVPEGETNVGSIVLPPRRSA